MAANPNPNPNASSETNARPLLLPEIGPDGLPRESPVIAYTEKIIEEEQLQLKKYIEENYSKIRDVERELANLTMEMKLTSGPKKAALEHMRKKIELSTERIRVAKLKEQEARKAWEAASNAVKDEEAIKQKLCEDLNNLVMESSNAQYARLEELKKRLESLNPSRSSTSVPSCGTTQAAPLVPVVLEAVNGSSGNTAVQSNVEDVPVRNSTSQQLSSDAEARTKKKSMIHGRGKGIGAVPKGRGSSAPGWTGAGFDVDGQS